jgi:hypothetical protein
MRLRTEPIPAFDGTVWEAAETAPCKLSLHSVQAPFGCNPKPFRARLDPGSREPFHTAADRIFQGNRLK